MKAGARKMSSRKMKDPAPKTTRDLRILNLKSARLFSSFLRGASYLKSPQNKFQKIEFLLCHMVFVHVKGGESGALEQRRPRSGQMRLAVGGFRPRFASTPRPAASAANEYVGIQLPLTWQDAFLIRHRGRKPPTAKCICPLRGQERQRIRFAEDEEHLPHLTADAGVAPSDLAQS